MATMQSTVRPHGLYCCGQILDIDGPSGPCNFMIDWATGRVAGINAAKYVLRGYVSGLTLVLF